MSNQSRRCPRPPFLALAGSAEIAEQPKLAAEAAPLNERIENLATLLAAAPITIPIEQGTTSIPTQEVFDVLSHRDDVPGAVAVQEVKFLIAGVDGGRPRLYFLNTNNFKYHFDFARDVLGIGLDSGEFLRIAYFTDARRFLAGTLLLHENFARADGSTGLFALEFWPTDPVKVRLTAMAYSLVRDALEFAPERVAYHPSGAIQEQLFLSEREEYDSLGIPVVTSEEIFSNISYSPLNLGVGYGKCRAIDGTESRPPSIRDIVIFKTLPNDLTHVAGVISEEPQTPLSHVNLKAKQNDTPNAYLRNAAMDLRIAPLIDRIVRLEVGPQDIQIREATTQEMEQFIEDQRPEQPQVPPRDLSQESIVPLDSIGHDDLKAYGAKAANVAELRKILAPQIVPAGFAVPFYFYHQFMSSNGLYEAVQAMLEDDAFRHDALIRDTRLKELRRRIKRSDVPEDLRAELGAMHASFPAGTTPRCRSSTNNEDLVGFNGAGLYDSFTHRLDEGHISKSIKQVWASLWNYRAYEEREFYRIDHYSTAMGVLVHPNFDDEKANGVALTKNVYFPGFSGFYVNVQAGEASVANPGVDDAVPEELLIMENVDPDATERYELIPIRRSNLVEEGGSVLTEDQIRHLTAQMEIIQRHFRIVYDRPHDKTFAMDLEFKIDKTDQLVIKQARPWVD